MSATLFCDDGVHILHRWSPWSIEMAQFERGILYGKRAGEKFTEQVRARQCKNCKQIDWKYL